MSNTDDGGEVRSALSVGLLRLLAGVAIVQAGYHTCTASLPIAMSDVGMTDAEIGLIVGSAALAQIPASLFAGVWIDAYGSRLLLLLGAAAYLVGGLVLLAPAVGNGDASLGFVVARVLQGVGLGIVIPAAFAMAAGLVSIRRRGLGLALAGSANTVAGMVFPAVSVVLLFVGSLQLVAAASTVLVSLGVGLLWLLPRRTSRSGMSGAPSSWRAVPYLRWRRQWARPLIGSALFGIYWGVVAAYLPQRAAAAGLNVGIFFALDGIMVLTLRTPVGLIADRMRPHRLILLSVAAGVMAMILLLPSPTGVLLAVAGATSGVAAAGFFTVLLVELGRRSDSSDWGRAFALLSAAQATAWLLGSAGTAALVVLGGFGVGVAVSIVGMLAAGAITFLDPDLGRDRAGRSQK